MTALTWLFFGLAAAFGFFIAWHWQRIKYEKVLKMIGDKLRAGMKHPAG